MTQPERQQDPEPNADARPVSRKMAELRQRAQHDPNFLYLLPSSMEPPKRKRSRRPWLLLGVGGAVLAAGAIAIVALGGSGGSSASPTPPSGSAPSDQAKAVAPVAAIDETPAPTATKVLPTPTPRSVEDTQREGAVPVPSSVATPPASAIPNFVTPLTRAGKVVDRFGSSRGEGYIHAGIDVSPGSGQFNVVPACDGSVGGSDHSGAYGDFVVVDCAGGWKTIYANMAQIVVKRGQLVAAGATTLGQAVDILHFEIRYTDSPIDPERYVNIAAGPIPPTPTPGPSPSPTATATATGVPGGSTPSGTEPPTGAAPTSTPQPPTATVVPTKTPTPTSTPTSTPTPRPAKKSPTPAPKLN